MNNEIFEDYMYKKNPNWQQMLSFNDITKLKELYELKKYYEERNKTLLQRQFSSLANIDYSTDYEKNNVELGKIYDQLNIMTSSITVTNELNNHNNKSI